MLHRAFNYPHNSIKLVPSNRMESLGLADVSFELQKPSKGCICVPHSSGEECETGVICAAQPPHSLLPWQHGRQSREFLERQKWSKKKFMTKKKSTCMSSLTIMRINSSIMVDSDF